MYHQIYMQPQGLVLPTWWKMKLSGCAYQSLLFSENKLISIFSTKLTVQNKRERDNAKGEKKNLAV